jgi:hypothetical protein
MPFVLAEDKFGEENEFGLLVGSGSIKVAPVFPTINYAFTPAFTHFP